MAEPPAAPAPPLDLLAGPVRYLLVGGGLFLVDLAIFRALVVGAGWAPWQAQAVSRTVGAALGFFGHRAFTFRAEGGRIASQGAGYAVVFVWNLLLSPVVVEGLVRALDGSLVAAKGVAEVFLVVQSYLLLKLVFRAEAR